MRRVVKKFNNRKEFIKFCWKQKWLKKSKEKNRENVPDMNESTAIAMVR